MLILSEVALAIPERRIGGDAHREARQSAAAFTQLRIRLAGYPIAVAVHVFGIAWLMAAQRVRPSGTHGVASGKLVAGRKGLKGRVTSFMSVEYDAAPVRSVCELVQVMSFTPDQT
jgi:hypothetical protein